MSNMTDFAVLVLSSDGYADLWPTFFEQFRRRWPECPYPVYLGTNTRVFTDHAFITTVRSGRDENWSTAARKILDQVRQPYLMVLLEDLLLIQDVDGNSVAETFAFMQRGSINHIQLACSLPSDGGGAGRYGTIARGAPYRVNVCGFWNKATLQSLLLDGESPWNFEIMGSYRSSYLDGFLRMHEPPLRLVNLVEKGLFLPAAVQYCREHGINPSTDSRGIAHGCRGIVSLVKALWFNIMVRVPWRVRVATMNLLRKLLVSY